VTDIPREVLDGGGNCMRDKKGTRKMNRNRNEMNKNKVIQWMK
jgi:hypothetical protein